jgi:hypothetical protein
VIENLKSRTLELYAGGGQPARALTVKFDARDSGSSIDHAQYSVDGGDWLLVSPVGNVSDAPEERFEFTIVDPAPGEHTIAVRAYDRFENIGSAKTTTTVPTTKP